MLFKEITKEELNKVINNSFSIFECLKKLGLPQNGRYFKKLDKLIAILNIDISHFGRGCTSRKYKRILVKCLNCNKEFIVKEGSPRQHRVCSLACSNTYFRSGKNHGNYKNGNSSDKHYRTICFKKHKKECIICREKRIVEVHHFDENEKNNGIINLIPLCSTHHKYVHSRYKKLIIDKIIVYRNNFISTENSSEEERTVWGGKVEIS